MIDSLQNGIDVTYSSILYIYPYQYEMISLVTGYNNISDFIPLYFTNFFLVLSPPLIIPSNCFQRHKKFHLQSSEDMNLLIQFQAKHLPGEGFSCDTPELRVHFS